MRADWGWLGRVLGAKLDAGLGPVCCLISRTGIRVRVQSMG